MYFIVLEKGGLRRRKIRLKTEIIQEHKRYRWMVSIESEEMVIA